MNPQFISALQNVILILQCITLVASVIALIVSLGKMANKPNKTQDSRLDALEAWQKEVNSRLERGNNHFESIDEGNTVMQNSLLAIMDALISGDNKAELPKMAKQWAYELEVDYIPSAFIVRAPYLKGLCIVS